MKRPLVWILLFFVVGIFLGRYLQNSIVLFCIIALLMTVALYYKFKLNIIFLFPIGLLLGFFLIYGKLNYLDANIEAFARNNETMSIEGIVIDVSKTKTGKYKAVVMAKTFAGITGESYKSKMRLQAYLDDGMTVEIGEKAVLKGELHLLDGLRNPGGFNEFQYMKSRKIQYKMYVDELEKKGQTFTFNSVFPEIRQKLANSFDKALPKNESAIMKAIIIGDQSDIDDFTKDIYSDAGIYHILSVSGLHISIFALLLTTVLGIIFSKRTTGIIVIIFLLFYCVLTGAGIATTRSVIMSIVATVGIIMGKKTDAIVTTSFAALCLLVYEPLYLWDVGFQYSFAAVYGLIIGTSAIERLFVIIKNSITFTRRFFDNKFISKYLAGSIAASLATIPVSMFHFYYLTPIGIITNMFIVPTSSLILIIGILICLLGILNLTLYSFLAIVCVFILKFYEFICIIAIKIPFSNILTGEISFITIVCIYAVLGFFYYMLYGKKEEMKKRCIYLGVTSVLLLALIIIPSFMPKQLEVAMLDVGQGDGIIINKGKVSFIVDGGGNSFKGIGNSTGDNVLVPYLDSKAISKVEAAFVTHTDADHAIGIIETMRKKHVKRLFLPYNAQFNEDDEIYDALLEASEIFDTQIIYLSEGDEMTFDKDIIVRCISPSKSKEPSYNEGSLVLKLSYKNSDFLFTGDVGFETENKLINGDYDIEAEVLKIAHHGSKYSTDEEFIDAISPSIAIISASRNNSYGHPSKEVLEKLKNQGVKIFNTPENAAILIKTDGNKIEVRPMIDGK